MATAAAKLFSVFAGRGESEPQPDPGFVFVYFAADYAPAPGAQVFDDQGQPLQAPEAFDN